MSDPECGRCKFCAREHEMKDKPGAPTTLPTSLDLYEFLKCKMIEPGDSLVKKKMCGIWRRDIWWVPSKGEGAVMRTTGEVDSLDGSASFHQFEDIGRAGFLNVRTRSCHQCDECWAGNSAACENEDVCGPVKLVEITCKAAVERPLTRSMLASEGIELSNGVEKGDFICIELDSLQEPYIICRALGGVEAWPAEKDNQYHWMGYCRTGDKVIWVEKLEGHGNLYKVMDNWRFPIFLEDVRLTKFDLKPRETRLSSRQQAAGVKAIERFDMSAELRVEILSRMPLECDKPLRGKDMRGTPEVQMPRNVETAVD